MWTCWGYFVKNTSFELIFLFLWEEGLGWKTNRVKFKTTDSKIIFPFWYRSTIQGLRKFYVKLSHMLAGWSFNRAHFIGPFYLLFVILIKKRQSRGKVVVSLLNMCQIGNQLFANFSEQNPLWLLWRNCRCHWTTGRGCFKHQQSATSPRKTM